jgi:transcriptional regulator with XRE-family HTH domain
MTAVQNPAVGRRKLRTALRRAREAAGRTQDQVASAMDWSLSKVIRIEAGAVGVSTNDVKALTQLYRIDDPEQVSALVDLARLSRQRPWWLAHRDLLPAGFLHYLGLEAGASDIRMFQISMMPGLFQTPEYAQAISADVWIGEPLPASDVDEWVTVRRTRQHEVLDRPDPPRIRAVIDEAVLRHVVGSRAVMRDQLSHLADLAGQDHIEVRVVPFTAGVPLYLSSFVILGFPDPDDTDLVYLEGSLDQLVIEEPKQMAQYGLAFDRLTDKALDRASSLALIRAAAGELG